MKGDIMAEVRKNKKNAKYDIDNINSCKSSKKEVKKVNEKKNTKVIRYSIATIMFIIFCSLFFYLINILFALVQSLI